MNNVKQYARQYYMPPEPCLDWVKKEYVDRAPIWCSVDLRDGNQSLIIPMSLDEKLEFFQLLVEIGFKQIEVGFPAASETEYLFLRTLIEKNMIPDDVTIQVLTQAREHIIRKTFEAVRGAKNVIVHLYNSTSVAQREQVFRKSKEEIIEIARAGAQLFIDLMKEEKADYRMEYSPESFTGTEPEFALEICNAVLDIWKPTKERKAIINLPVTVELSMPHVYASQIEYMHKHLKYRDAIEISLHPHNDRGCGVADTEMGLLAGADRVEGTLFGNGERTGNVDIVTLGMNMYSQGVDPQLDFSNMPKICELYERVTRMHVYERSPYSGALVFAAFSGSHQDAIAKGMKWREETDSKQWTVPYLPIDPHDVGREYETSVIRINSQSGKGGIGYLLEQYFGYNLPAKMRETVGYAIKSVSDHRHAELKPEEVFAVFQELFVNVSEPLTLVDCHFAHVGNLMEATVTASHYGTTSTFKALGNGRLDAVSEALKAQYGLSYGGLTYQEHALAVESTSQTDAKAASYVSLKRADGQVFWGAGVDNDIILSSIRALFSALNRMLKG
ncbi:MAG: 2-isopropylmalate synthase [Clostridia bacterium]|nr:2-isopropylmalate synthase [Clostridia bacterium]